LMIAPPLIVNPSDPIALDPRVGMATEDFPSD
jgi:hypothetical protein